MTIMLDPTTGNPFIDSSGNPYDCPSGQCPGDCVEVPTNCGTCEELLCSDCTADWSSGSVDGWVRKDNTGGVPFVSGGELRVPGSSDARAATTCPNRLYDDFDCEIEFAIGSGTPQSISFYMGPAVGGSATLLIQRRTDGQWVTAVNASVEFHAIYTSGWKARFARVSGTTTLYRQDGSGWLALRTTTSVTTNNLLPWIQFAWSSSGTNYGRVKSFTMTSCTSCASVTIGYVGAWTDTPEAYDHLSQSCLGTWPENRASSNFEISQRLSVRPTTASAAYDKLYGLNCKISKEYPDGFGGDFSFRIGGSLSTKFGQAFYRGGAALINVGETVERARATTAVTGYSTAGWEVVIDGILTSSSSLNPTWIRMERIGSTLNVYAYSSSTWNLIDTDTGFGTDAVIPCLYVASDNTPMTQSDWAVISYFYVDSVEDC